MSEGLVTIAVAGDAAEADLICARSPRSGSTAGSRARRASWAGRHTTGRAGYSSSRNS